VTAAWQGIWAAALTALAALGWWTKRRHASAVPALILCGIFAVFVGWYSKVFPATPPTRLLYPALILIPVYAALGFGGLMARLAGATRISESTRSKTRSAGLVILLAATLAGLTLHSGGWIGKDPRRSYNISPILKIQMALTQKLAKPGEAVLVSDYFANHLFYFKDELGGAAVSWPKLDSMEDLRVFMREKNIRYAFIDLATALYNPQVLGDYYRAERSGHLRALKPMPAGFTLIPRDPRIPPAFELYAYQPN
jgi:hypothetical protein